MSVRVKGSGKYQYLQVVHNKRVNGKVRQEVVARPNRERIREEGSVYRPAPCQHSRAIHESNRFANTKQQQVSKGDES